MAVLPRKLPPTTAPPYGVHTGVSTSAFRGGGGRSVAPPGSRPPVSPLPPAPTPAPVYAPPPAADPRINNLIRAIQDGTDGTGQQQQASASTSRLAELSRPVNVRPLDMSDIEGQGAQVKALMQALMRGEGPSVGDVSRDPEAQAYAVAKEREAARMREEAAARLGASGVEGSGDFDAEVLGIREATGEAKARQVAELTGRRRAEMLNTALSGANLQMSDLERQARNRQTEYLSQVDLERMRREGILAQSTAEAGRTGTELTAKQRLLETLLGERDRGESLYRGDQERKRTEETRRLAEELQKRELEEALWERRYSPWNRPQARAPWTAGIAR